MSDAWDAAVAACPAGWFGPAVEPRWPSRWRAWYRDSQTGDDTTSAFGATEELALRGLAEERQIWSAPPETLDSEDRVVLRTLGEPVPEEQIADAILAAACTRDAPPGEPAGTAVTVQGASYVWTYVDGPHGEHYLLLTYAADRSYGMMGMDCDTVTP